MFSYLGIRHIGVSPRVKFTFVYVPSEFDLMDCPENERVPSIDELSGTIPVLSEYCRKLDDHAKRTDI